MPIRLHIGGHEARDDWKILDVNPGPLVDYVGDCKDLSFLEDASCSEIYASHVLEHLSYNGDLQLALKEFHRVLIPDGRLRVSVPDLHVLALLFVHPNITNDDKFEIMRMIFGGHADAADSHQSGFTYAFLSGFLQTAGFRKIGRIPEFNEFKDTSSFRFGDVLISLNVEASK
jgi:predicted SAM-dependent methyltransferase